MARIDMMQLIERLYPLPRSMTGDGVRDTLSILSESIPIEVTEVPSGTEILDWTVPKEWNIKAGWIKGPDGSTIVDFADLNLHVAGYSVPVDAHMSLAELQPHLHSLPENPDAVPYRTGYFAQDWGFCLADEVRRDLVDGDYEVFIDSTLEDGSLTYGEFFLPGDSRREIVLSAHTCHPSLVNDNLSGIAVAAALGQRYLERPKRRFGLRIIFAPATVGAIAWLSQNPDATQRIHAGMTLVCLGDGAALTYKRSVDGNRRIDRVAARSITQRSGAVIDFYPFGYDERHYNSPGFRIPFGSLMRSRHGTFPEYHTSQDDLNFVDAQQLEDALDAVTEIVDELQTDRLFMNLSPHGEPQLGRRGLYTSVQNAAHPEDLQYAILWMLSMSDAEHGLHEIAAASGIGHDVLERAVALLVEHRLLEEIDP